MISTACATTSQPTCCATCPRASFRPVSTRCAGSRSASRRYPFRPSTSRRSSREIFACILRTLPDLSCAHDIVIGALSVHSGRNNAAECVMDELNGKMIACQILVTGLIARVANEQRDPLRFLTDFRDEIRAVVKGVNIAGMDNTDRVRLVAQQTVDELFSLMKPPSAD